MTHTRKASKTWLIVQYEDRPLDKNHTEFIRRNKIYAKKHGYAYIFLNKGYKHLPPYWRKVAIAKHYLDTDKYKGVMWLDSDAVIFNMNISLDRFDSSLKHFFKAINSGGNQIFNAGVWTVKNTPTGKKIMEKWMGHYDPSKWKQTGNSWSSNDEWAGQEYEQGSFAYKIVPEHKRNINTLNEPFLQGLYQNSDGKGGHNKSNVFVYHFYNHFRSREGDFIRENPVA
jgi:hypothetical protein